MNHRWTVTTILKNHTIPLLGPWSHTNFFRASDCWKLAFMHGLTPWSEKDLGVAFMCFTVAAFSFYLCAVAQACSTNHSKTARSRCICRWRLFKNQTHCYKCHLQMTIGFSIGFQTPTKSHKTHCWDEVRMPALPRYSWGSERRCWAYGWQMSLFQA